jgi:predicted RNA binding protein YcfA (HicA-like mRNA interferase family)
MKLKEILSLLREDGWYQVAQRGSHKQFKHSIKLGRITVPDHGQGKDLAKGTVNSIIKQAGLRQKL